MTKEKERPKGLSATAIAVVVSELVGLIFVKWSDFAAAPPYVVPVAFGVTLAAFGAVVWFYWQGRNWARWLVMLWAVLPFLFVLRRGYSVRPLALDILDGSFTLFLLYWLNTKRIRAFFSAQAASSN
jgi:hypothetical protein